jgi:hypothetical protein
MSTSAEFALANEIYALNYRRSGGEADVDIRAPSRTFLSNYFVQLLSVNYDVK